RAYNNQLPFEARRDPRALHEEEAAFFIKSLTPLVAQCGNMEYEMADKVTSYAAIMIVVHDKHADFQTMIRGTERAYQMMEGSKRVSISDDLLWELYDKQTIDLMSLSPRQWYVIAQKTRMTKEEQFPSLLPRDVHSRYGFIPSMESAFKEYIERAIHDDTHGT